MIFGTTISEADKTAKSITLLGQEIKNVNTSNVGFGGIISGLKKINTQAIKAEISARALNLAFNSLFAIGISLAVSGISKWINAEKEAAEAAEKLRKEQEEIRKNTLQNIDNYKQETRELSSLVSEYVKLVSSTDDIVSIKSELSNIQDKINSKYGVEKEGIDLVNKSLEENIRLLTEKSEIENKEWLRENSEGVSEAKRIFGLTNLDGTGDADSPNYALKITKSMLESEFGSSDHYDEVKAEARKYYEDVIQILKDEYSDVFDNIDFNGEVEGERYGDVYLNQFVLGLKKGLTAEQQLETSEAITSAFEKVFNLRKNITEYFDTEEILNNFYDILKIRQDAYSILVNAREYSSNKENLKLFEKSDRYEEYLTLVSKAVELNRKLNDETSTTGEKYISSLQLEEIKNELQDIANEYPSASEIIESSLSGIGLSFTKTSSAVETAKSQWLESLDEAQKGVLSNIDKIKSAMQTLANGGKLSSKDFWEIAGFDTDHLLSNITTDNGEFSVDIDSLIKLKDSLIQNEIDGYKDLRKELKSTYNDLVVELRLGSKDISELETEIAEKNVDINQTIFGNIDTNERQILSWTETNLEKYKDAIESWGSTTDELAGSISTVFGAYGEYDGIDIAFSPILQTSDGAVLLSKETVDKYITKLIEEAGEGWTNEDLFKLDVTGLEIDGMKINKLLADIGETSAKTSEAMHFTGATGALARAKSEYDQINNKAQELLGVMSEQDVMVEYLNSLLGDTIDKQKVIDALIKQTQEEVSKLKEELSDLNSKADGMLKAQEHVIDGIIDKQEEELDALEKQLEVIEEQKSELEEILDNYQTAANVVTKLVDKQIEKLEEEREAIEDSYDARIKKLKEENEEREDALEYEKKLANLANAEKNKIHTYSQETGWTYEADKIAIQNAQDELDKYKAEQEIKKLEKEKETTVESYEKQIKPLEKYRKEWESAIEDITSAEDELLAEQILGADWREKISKQDLETLDKFKSGYSTYNTNLKNLVKGEETTLKKSIEAKKKEVESWKEYKTEMTKAASEIKGKLEEYVNYLDTVKLSENSTNEERENNLSSFVTNYTALIDSISAQNAKIEEAEKTLKAFNDEKDRLTESGGISLNTGNSVLGGIGGAAASANFGGVIETVLSAVHELQQRLFKSLFHYANGGAADYTGLAWVDGTKTSSETVFTAAQSKKLLNLVEAMPNINYKALNGSVFRGGTTNTSSQSVVVNGGITVVANNPEQFNEQMQRYLRTKLTESKIY